MEMKREQNEMIEGIVLYIVLSCKRRRRRREGCHGENEVKKEKEWKVGYRRRCD
jgi:hypothetical protein